MALRIDMTKDIRKYDRKSVLNRFTVRQAVFISIGLAYAVPIAFAVPLPLHGIELVFSKIVIATILAIPMITAGFITMDNTPMEILAIRFIYQMLLTPRKRKYKAKNLYAPMRKALNPKDIKYGKGPDFKMYY